MADEKQVFLLDLDIKEFTQNALSAKGMIQRIGDADNVSGLVEGLMKVGKGLAIVGVAAAALKVSFDLVFEAERVQRINNLFNQLAGSVGLVGEKLKEDLVKSTNGLATETEVLQAANKAIISMGASAEKLPQIMDLARRYTKSFGGDLVDNFERINMAVSTGSQRMLKMMGITVDVDKAVRDYAKSHGHLADEITQAGKQQAIMNAVLEFGDTRLKGLKSTGESATTTWKQFKVAMSELAEICQIFFGTILGPLIKGISYLLKGTADMLVDVSTRVKDHLLVGMGSSAEAAGARVKILHRNIEDLQKSIDRFEERKKNMGSGFNDNSQLDFLKKQQAAMQAELEKSEKEKEEIYKRDLGISKETNEAKLFDDDKTEKNSLRLREETLKMKENLNRHAIDMAKTQDELDRAEQEEKTLADQEYLLKKEKLEQEHRDGKIRTDEEMRLQTELLEQEHQQRMDEIDDPARKEANQNKMLDNYLRRSQNTFDGIGRAAEVSAKRASMAMNNFGKQGMMVVNTIQKRGSEAFMAFGKAVIDHSQSASQIMKGFFLNTLADIAQSQGELYLAMGLVDPSKLAAGAALLVLSGALRAMAGSAGGSSGGSGYDAGSGGAGGYQATNSQGQEKVQQAEKKSVNVQIMGNYFETEQTKTRLLEMIRESTDATDFKYQQIGGQ